MVAVLATDIGVTIGICALLVMALVAVIAAVAVVASVSGVETRDGEGERE